MIFRSFSFIYRYCSSADLHFFMKFVPRPLEFYIAPAYICNKSGRIPAILNRGKFLQLFHIEIRVYFFTQGNTDIYHSGILGDQLIAIGNHFLCIPFRIDQGVGRRERPDLANGPVLLLIRVQFEEQLPAPRYFNTISDKFLPVVLFKGLADIRSSYHHISIMWEIILDESSRMIIVRNTRHDDPGSLRAHPAELLLIPL